MDVDRVGARGSRSASASAPARHSAERWKPARIGSHKTVTQTQSVGKFCNSCARAAKKMRRRVHPAAAGHGLPAAQRSTGEKWDWPVHWGHETVAIMSESRFREVYREACDRSGKALPLRKNTWRLIVFAAAVLILPREWGQNQSLERVARQEESCRRKWAQEVARRVRAQQREQQQEQQREERAGAAAAAASVDFS